jgi:hypothetical protein
MGAAATVCRPNISRAGRIRRTRIGYGMVGFGLVLFAVTLGLHAAWWARALVFLPAMMAAITLLQVSRNTCVAHAAKGTFEHDDFSTTPQSDEDAAASKRVAATIYRDAFGIGLVSAFVAAATAFVG